jgi:immune inhibitor A
VRNLKVGLLSLSVVSALAVVLSPSAFASPAPANTAVAAPASQTGTGDDLPNPFEAKRRELRQQAWNKVLNGEATPAKRGASSVVKVGKTAASKPSSTSLRAAPAEDQYVELKREKTDKIFVILAEFGNERHPQFPDKDLNPTIPGPATFEGPLHNKIPEPDRKVDNKTNWKPDYDPAHYQKLYFDSGPGVESLKTYLETQSSGRYSVDGKVTDWVKVKYNEARYGRSHDPVPAGQPGDDPAVCSASNCGNVHELIRDAANQWVKDQQAQGRTDEQIKADLAAFDEWDRYDHDNDGDFNEADGYIDHFQIVHSGGDQAEADPHQGEDAIWSHRWHAFLTDAGKTGPPANKHGGTQVGNTGLWIGDYTMQPENGPLSLFAHEYVHDLGEPDYYDTSGGGDNSVEYWSLMAQSRLGGKGDQGIGTKPGDMGAAVKFNLGWLDYEVVVAGQQRTVNLGPSEYNTKKPQALVVVLPKKKHTIELAKPYAGAGAWWSGSDDELNNTLTRTVTLPAGAAELKFQANWDIEDCEADACDYAFVEVDDGTGWKAIPGSITKSAEGNGIDGKSAGWVPATFDLSAYAGKSVGLRFRYSTDGGVMQPGLLIDELTLTAGGQTILTDGAESGLNGWTATGFKAVGGPVTREYDHRYIATNRRYVSYDKYLEHGPYNFGWLTGENAKPSWVEHYAYQQGLLVTYIDTSQKDNNTNVHPGTGMALVVDAHPRPVYKLDGLPWRSRIQMYDAPFGLAQADSMTLHFNGQPSYIRGQEGQPTFNDTKKYFFPELPNHGVKLPAVGVKIQVVAEEGTSVKVRVSKAIPK